MPRRHVAGDDGRFQHELAVGVKVKRLIGEVDLDIAPEPVERRLFPDKFAGDRAVRGGKLVEGKRGEGRGGRRAVELYPPRLFRDGDGLAVVRDEVARDTGRVKRLRQLRGERVEHAVRARMRASKVFVTSPSL